MRVLHLPWWRHLLPWAVFLGVFLVLGAALSAVPSWAATPAVDCVTPGVDDPPGCTDPAPVSSPSPSPSSSPVPAPACSAEVPCVSTLDPSQFAALGAGISLLVFLSAAGLVSSWGRRG